MCGVGPGMSRALATSFGFLLVVAATTACEDRGTRPDGPKSASPSTVASVIPKNAAAAKVEVPEVHIKADGTTTVRVTWSTPKGTQVNDDAPFRVRWNRSDGLADAPSDVKSVGSAVKDGFRVSIKPMAGAVRPTLAGEIDIVVCDADAHSVCVPVQRKVELGFVAAKDAADSTTVAVPLPAAR
jgi:hypothetical protein